MNILVLGDIFGPSGIKAVTEKLPEIIKISREIVKKPHKLLILKGKDAQSEINNISLGSNYSYKLESSITDSDSKIIIIEAKQNE